MRYCGWSIRPSSHLFLGTRIPNFLISLSVAPLENHLRSCFTSQSSHDYPSEHIYTLLLNKACSNLFKLVQTCWNSLKLVETCWNLLKLVETCWNLFKLVETRWNSFKLVEICSNLFKLVQTCSKVINISNSKKILWNGRGIEEILLKLNSYNNKKWYYLTLWSCYWHYPSCYS